jgi:regulator of protease activity HflC (stomatin/prohibitin superfamily)
MLYLAIFLIFLAVMFLASAIRIVKEYEQAVIFRLGKYIGKLKGPGLIILIPIIDKMEKRVDLRVTVVDVPPQDIITRDNVSVNVNAVLNYRVIDPDKAAIQVEDYKFATSQKAQTTLRSVLGEVDLDDLLANREKINERLQEIIDRETDPWGIKVSAVEVKHVDLPQEMERAIARQAQAERERRAKVIHAEGEYQAAAKLKEAAGTISTQPMALQLRFLQTLTEISLDSNSTLLFPLPLDLIKPFVESKRANNKEAEQEAVNK